MGTKCTVGAETAKLAGLQIDLLQKICEGRLTQEQLEWWLNQRSEDRERYMRLKSRNIVRRTSKIIATRHIIDCDADPFLPEGWKGVESHKKMGKIEWDPTKVRLHLSPNQQNGKTIQGHKLREELANEPVLNANVLDYLLAHPELIPEEWKGKYVFFWGTIYRISGGGLCVRYLFWGGGRWGWFYSWLGPDWYDYSPSACLQVSS